MICFSATNSLCSVLYGRLSQKTGRAALYALGTWTRFPDAGRNGGRRSEGRVPLSDGAGAPQGGSLKEATRPHAVHKDASASVPLGKGGKRKPTAVGANSENYGRQRSPGHPVRV